jgi:hypothetical protein
LLVSRTIGALPAGAGAVNVMVAVGCDWLGTTD